MSLQDFQILNKLGDGTYSTVFKAKRISDGQDYAIKKVKMAALSEKEKLNALNEVRLLASINNPYIVGFKEVFFEDNTTLCVVMEYVGGGDLHHGILKHTKANTVFKEKSIWRYAIQMILGLKTLHDKMILHRDLKCANVFLSKDEKCAKLGDLNVSKVVKNALAYTQTGTPYYASPEVWRDEPYDAKSDIWSLGCVIYEICALKPPFRANDMPGLFKKVQKGAFEKIPSAYSQDLFTLISLCLQVSPAKRLSCDQLLEHPVVQRNSQDILTQYDETEETLDLLHTIRIPKNAKNLRALRLHLPKSNYKEHVKSAEFNSHHQRVSNIKDFQLAEQHSTILEKLITSKDSENEIKNSPKSVVLRKNKTPFESPKDADRKEQLDKIYREHRDLIKPIKSIEIPMPSTKRARKGLKLVDQSLRGQRSEAFIEEGLREKKVKSLLQEQKSAILQSHILERNSRLLDDRDEEDRRQSVNRNKSKERIGKVHEDRLDAMERRAQNLIQKYQQDVGIAKKREETNNKASPDLKNKRPSNDGIDRRRNPYEVKQSISNHERQNATPLKRVDPRHKLEEAINKSSIGYRKSNDSLEISRIKDSESILCLRKGEKPVLW